MTTTTTPAADPRLQMQERLPAPATMASPSWWGADSERYRLPVGPGGEPAAFVKVVREVSTAYVDVAGSFAAAQAAGLAGLGPRVQSVGLAERVLVMDDHSATCRTATSEAFLDDAVLERYLAARRAVQHLDVPAARRASVFDDIRTVHAAALRHGAQLPDDLAWMLRILAVAEERITAAADREANPDTGAVFCHGDGNVSNVLLDEAGQVLLLDWDVAAVMDPLQDLGAVVSELTSTEDEARELFERAHGSWDRSAFARCRLYGVADLVRWALIGSYVDSVDPGTLEYSKFADWQFLRARWALAERSLDDRLNDL
ncbi:hypothetical protein FHR75_004190 [Kineococcus radiotolerans]|uniref:Aminoglycoside phosphotransferase domain-containing protein n=1 Tax=Kineococcus radiotolerans TaxID=131568 RepID=A0A7W4XYS0_KINRA|nr:phosphotransferase [Kineococcus radiotolerans]MBB2903348.1 hypothetical protein [Kineococcus radiotolerans]